MATICVSVHDNCCQLLIVSMATKRVSDAWRQLKGISCIYAHNTCLRALHEARSQTTIGRIYRNNPCVWYMTSPQWHCVTELTLFTSQYKCEQVVYAQPSWARNEVMFFPNPVVTFPVPGCNETYCTANSCWACSGWLALFPLCVSVCGLICHLYLHFFSLQILFLVFIFRMHFQ